MLEYEFETHDEMIELSGVAGEMLSVTIDKIAKLYLKNDKAWVIGFSGGKDSTVVLSLIFQALALNSFSRSNSSVVNFIPICIFI